MTDYKYVENEIDKLASNHQVLLPQIERLQHKYDRMLAKTFESEFEPTELENDPDLARMERELATLLDSRKKYEIPE